MKLKSSSTRRRPGAVVICLPYVSRDRGEERISCFTRVCRVILLRGTPFPLSRLWTFWEGRCFSLVLSLRKGREDTGFWRDRLWPPRGSLWVVLSLPCDSLALKLIDGVRFRAVVIGSEVVGKPVGWLWWCHVLGSLWIMLEPVVEGFLLLPSLTLTT